MAASRARPLLAFILCIAPAASSQAPPSTQHCRSELEKLCDVQRRTSIFECGTCVGANQGSLHAAGCSSGYTQAFCANQTCTVLPSLCAVAKAQGSFECAVCIGEATADGKLNGTFCTKADEEAYCSGQAPPPPPPPPPPPFTGPIRFNYTGSPQNYTVPAGVATLNLTVAGARGSNGNNGFKSSPGGLSVGTLAVTPGQLLFVMVGGTGGGTSSKCSPAGGWNGGAAGNSGFASLGCGGGGASDVRTDVNDLHSRIIVAGGGGGPPGSGGTAGVGGGASGGAACAQDDFHKSTVPGGNQSAGGNTGQRGAGGFGVGGQCASNSVWCSGGGGGWYGGAAPPKDDMDKCMGGGGGSGYISGSGLSDATMASGHNAGPGFVEITAVVTQLFTK